jgi:hypothetical protein
MPQQLLHHFDILAIGLQQGGKGARNVCQPMCFAIFALAAAGRMLRFSSESGL